MSQRDPRESADWKHDPSFCNVHKKPRANCPCSTANADEGNSLLADDDTPPPTPAQPRRENTDLPNRDPSSWLTRLEQGWSKISFLHKILTGIFAFIGIDLFIFSLLAPTFPATAGGILFFSIPVAIGGIGGIILTRIQNKKIWAGIVVLPGIFYIAMGVSFIARNQPLNGNAFSQQFNSIATLVDFVPPHLLLIASIIITISALALHALHCIDPNKVFSQGSKSRKTAIGLSLSLTFTALAVVLLGAFGEQLGISALAAPVSALVSMSLGPFLAIISSVVVVVGSVLFVTAITFRTGPPAIQYHEVPFYDYDVPLTPDVPLAPIEKRGETPHYGATVTAENVVQAPAPAPAAAPAGPVPPPLPPRPNASGEEAPEGGAVNRGQPLPPPPLPPRAGATPHVPPAQLPPPPAVLPGPSSPKACAGAPAFDRKDVPPRPDPAKVLAAFTAASMAGKGGPLSGGGGGGGGAAAPAPAAAPAVVPGGA